MVTLTNTEATIALNALQELAQQRMPFSLALKIRALVRTLRDRMGDVEEERQKLIEEHAERDEEGNKIRTNIRDGGTRWEWQMADLDAYRADYDALMATTSDCPEALTVTEMEGVEEVKPAILLDLGPLLVDAPPGGEPEP